MSSLLIAYPVCPPGRTSRIWPAAPSRMPRLTTSNHNQPGGTWHSATMRVDQDDRGHMTRGRIFIVAGSRAHPPSGERGTETNTLEPRS